MARIFLIVSVTAFIAFVAGLVQPERAIFWSSRKTRMQALVYLVVFAVFGAIWLLVRQRGI